MKIQDTFETGLKLYHVGPGEVVQRILDGKVQPECYIVLHEAPQSSMVSLVELSNGVPVRMSRSQRVRPRPDAVLTFEPAEEGK